MGKPLACYLRMGSDTLGEARKFSSVMSAKAEFYRVASELADLDQQIDGTIHIANTRAELVEDADYYLALGPRGGLKMERMS